MLDLHKHMKNQESDWQISTNEAAARALGLPDIRSLPRPHYPHLAIVGGGPSINKHKNALRNWRGAVWALNGAAVWCSRHKIKCTLFTVDASTSFNPELRHVKNAILSARCHPSLFELLKDAKIVLYDFPANELGPNSAGTACVIATRFAGYTDITFFGCEGSYVPGESHAVSSPVEVGEFLVECGNERFLTTPDFLMVNRAIAHTIRQFPTKVSERSGGLLAAIVKHGEYKVVGLSPALAKPTTPKVFVEAYNAYMESTRMEMTTWPTSASF